MNKTSKITGCIAMLLIVVSYSCNQNQSREAVNGSNEVKVQDNKKETKEAITTASNYLEQQKDSVRKGLDEQAAKLDEMLKKAQSDLVAAEDVTKTKIEKKEDFLKDRRLVLSSKYKRLEAATEETWPDIKTELNSYLDSLKAELQKD